MEIKRNKVLLIVCFIILISGCTKNNTLPEANNLTENEAKIVEVNSEPFQEIEKVEVAITDVEEETKTSTEISEQTQAKVLLNKVIVIDAGHGISSNNKQEAIAPNSTETKPAFASGTHGANLTEEELNLIVALKLKNSLEGLGATVHLTREQHECDISNIGRAQFANELNADISVKIHADGIGNSSAHGVSVLVPGSKYISDTNLINESRKAAECILEKFVEKTGANNRGVITRNDMTGFNWSEVPVVLIELGFMTNPAEDALMETEEYQTKMVDGITQGLIKYFN